MSDRYSKNDSKLESLEKWRSSELNVAQVAHAVKHSESILREKAVGDVQQVIDESQDLARMQMAGNCVISVESLTRLNHFTAVQLNALQEAQTVLEAARREVADAHAMIVAKFEDLTVVERLRKRRAAQADKEVMRREQRVLDDQALLRASDKVNDQVKEDGV